jgi:16S rRNA processing protein RimM
MNPSPSGEGQGWGSAKGAVPSERPHPIPSPEGEGLNRRVTLAAVAGAHGIKGEVRLKLFTDNAEGLKRYRQLDADGRALTLQSVRLAGAGAVARFAEVADRSAAEALRGVTLTVPREALPALADGEYYHADLIGLPVVTPAGDSVGRVLGVENFGAGDVLDVEKPDGKSFMAPMHAVTVEAERLIIDPLFIV